MTATAKRLLRCLVQGCGGAVEGLGEDAKLDLCARRFHRFNGVANSRNHLGGVAGEFAGRIDAVFVPGAARQARRDQQRVLRRAERAIEGGGVGRRMLEVLKFVGSLGGSGEVAGGGQRAGKVEVQSLARGASARLIQITANLDRKSTRLNS